MNSGELLDAIGGIDDRLIWGAVNDTAQRKGESGKRWLKWAAAAAAFALVVCAGISRLTRNPSRDEPLELPMLAVSEPTNEGMGFEGYWAYDITEVADNNPWSGTAELSALPVYQNRLSFGENFFVSGVNLEEMQAFLMETASRLGLDIDALEIYILPDAKEQAAIAEKPGDEPPEGTFDPMTRMVAETDGIKIEVDISLTATIWFEPAVSLPEGYVFSRYASYADTLAVAEYLEEAYHDLIGMENPKISIEGGDYNIYLQQGYQIEFYDETGDLTEQIINYNFDRVIFYSSEAGKLDLVRIMQPDLSDKLGDYPIISAKEAQKRLLDGNYLTTVPYEMPGRKYIVKRELVYRTRIFENYYMPYYRFYVELPEEKMEGGVKSYGAYYVPAVWEEYITNMPVWDGRFDS